MVVENKKVYSKPELYYESFKLSQDIAGGCEGIALHGEYVCAVSISVTGMDDGLLIFQDGGVCMYSPPNPDDYVCYHAPTEMNNVFNS